MKRLVDLLAPRNALDFAFKLALFLLLIGVTNYLRDFFEHGADRDSLWRNLVEATFVALPFSVLALALVGHMHKLQGQLVELATTDLLTGLPNRRAFLMQLDRWPDHGAGALLMVDVDHFKAVNDTYGHDIGDLCLQAVATHLRQCLGDGDALARLGGEEFAALIGTDPAARLDDVGTAIARGFDFAAQDDAPAIRVSTSVGAVPLTSGEEASALLRRADAALYQAKAAGRARMVVWDDAAAPGAQSPDRHRA